MNKNILTQFAAWYSIFWSYRECKILNKPPSRPAIVYFNHNNLFFDALIAFYFLGNYLSIVSAKSAWRFGLIRFFFSSTQNIQIQRPQDIGKLGKGSIIKMGGQMVEGVNTKFTSILPAQMLVIERKIYKVKEIKSDTLILAQKVPAKVFQTPTHFHILAQRRQYTHVYQQVWSLLDNNKYVGIFPEGTSHDHPHILPFKGGIAIMVLGNDIQKMKNIPIVPIGINFHEQHKLRAKVLGEVGEPYYADDKLYDLFKKDKQAATAQVLNQLQKRLQAVTLNSKIFKDFNLIIFVRQLYCHTKGLKNLSDGQKLQYTRKVSVVFDELYPKSDKFKQLVQKIDKTRLIGEKNYFKWVKSLERIKKNG